MSASSNQESSISQCSFLCIWSIYYSLEQKVIFIYAQAKNNLFWLKRAISSDSAKMTHPQRETLLTGPWSLTLRKNLKSQKAPFADYKKQSQRVFINTKKCPLDIFTTQGFPCNLSNSIDCIQIHFQNFRTSKSQTTAKSRGLFLFLSKLNLLWHSLKV